MLKQCGSTLYVDPTNVAAVEFDKNEDIVIISIKTPIYELGEPSSRISTDWCLDDVVRALG